MSVLVRCQLCAAKLTFLVKCFNQLVCNRTRRERLSRNFGNHRIALFVASERSCASHLNRLHARHAPGSDLWYQLANAVCLCKSLGFFHEKPSHGDAAAWAEISGSVIAHAQPNHAAGANNVFVGAGVIGSFIGVLVEFGFEGANLVLQLNDIVSVDFAALGGIQVLADRAGSLAGKTSGKGRVASSFALGKG